MSLNAIGALGVLSFVILVFLRMPVGLSMLTMGIVGYWYVNGWSKMLVVLGSQPYRVLTQFTLTCLPPFILMGELALRTWMSTDAYDLARKWLGHFRGGLAVATIGASALFACVTGSPLAVALTMVGVSLPEMRKAGYDDRLSFGTIATGALLGPMIPPSTTFVIYAFITEVNLGYLLIGGIMPGLMMAVLYVITIFILVKLNPSIATAGPKYSWKERFLSAPGVWAIAAVFAFVLWGIYTGVFSPTEAGALGVFAVMLIGLIKRKLTMKGLWDSLRNAGRSTGMIVSVVTGVFVFNAFLATTRLPFNLADTISTWPVPSSVIMLAIIMVYVVAGFFMDVMAVVQMTVPVFFPVVVAMGYDPVWFGVIIVLVVGLGQITPPYGMLVFSLQAYTRDVDTLTIFKGAWPFVYSNVVALALLVFFPQIAYWLPYLGKRV